MYGENNGNLSYKEFPARCRFFVTMHGFRYGVVRLFEIVVVVELVFIGCSIPGGV